MASNAGRKKSIVSNTEAPVANNTLLNKAASQSTSLYQQCSSLRTRLIRIVNFTQFFILASHPDSRQSTDPVTQLWDLFSTGISLCYIYNLLPPPHTKIDIEINTSTFDILNDRAKKRAIALFAMQMPHVEDCERFTVTDLWDRNSTDGLVKVINNVTTIVGMLPSSAFEQAPLVTPAFASPQDAVDVTTPETPTLPAAPASAQEAARNNIIREMVETERKYVQDLEIMQKYSNALSQSNTVDQDTIHYLFPNLNKLLNFQRKFLIRLESTAELPWSDQRWGHHFIESEEEFVVYEPYCANYTVATELMLANEQNLIDLSHMMNVKALKGELPAFLIKPIQRVCKYPLLIDSLIKASNPASYPHYEELLAGHAAAKRIADKINEAQRRSENEETVKSLHNRVGDWKGHHLSNFGELLLDDIFVVTKSEVDREYHVFLFEKIILCCKEVPQFPQNGARKVGKNNSILKKQPAPSPLSLPGGVGQPHKKNTPLLLKGRIFLNNVTQAVPSPPTNVAGSSFVPQYPLAVWWRGDDDLEFFTLRCRTLDTMKQWETQINRLIKEAASRRASERGMSRIAGNSTNPAPQGRFSSASQTTERGTSSAPQSVYLSAFPTNAVAGRVPPFSRSPYNSSDEQVNSTNGGPQGYPPHDGFDLDELDDEFEDYPPTNVYASSGRGTPIGPRRGALSMPPERDAVPGHDRPRAQTEDTNGAIMAQWRTNGAMPPPPPPNAAPSPALRPITPRLTSNASVVSYNSDSSFGNGVRPRPALRSQFSSNKLKSVYDTEDGRTQASTPAPSTVTITPISRSRSASQPTAYIPKATPPPLPTTSSHWTQRANTSTGNNKRGSGSSQSTGDSSEYSPNSSSPITPFGSSESSLGAGGRPPRSQHFEHAVNGSAAHLNFSHPVKVKVHFNEDIFVIQVPRSTEYDDLVERVGRKIRLCGPRRDDGPLRVKYKDEDGDMVSLGSTEDVQMAFEQFRPGGQVILFVT